MAFFNPVTLQKLKRFRSISRGFWSFVIIATMVFISFFAEVFINSRALVVSYQGKWYFPTYGDMIPGSTFDLDYAYETNYRDLKEKMKSQGTKGFVLMPPVPYNPYENDLRLNEYPPFPPSFEKRHFLGTDNVGRDILARLVYGFRTAILFSFTLLILNYTVGIVIGCSMGYFGGKFDLFFQRVIEIWSNIPFLYVIIIISSIVVPSFMILILIMAFFGWIGITWVMRTMTYKEKEREYILAVRSLGASHFRIIFRHIIPNTISVIVTYAPFAISGGIVSLTSLDYLGFGLPAPTPSWGELLSQGWQNMEAWWISASVVGALVITLMTVTFTGEGIREAFDPKTHTIYE
ncbi:MAG: peptide ABC transporter permease [Desulfobacterales bacterium]|nr:MAG: peptide ABC transporter permease [Desulfobacterales bacterium]